MTIDLRVLRRRLSALSAVAVLGVASVVLFGSASASAAPDAAPDCTTNSSSFDYATDTLYEKGNMAGCARGKLYIRATLDGVQDNGPITCGNATSCSLPTYVIQACWTAGSHEVVVYGTRFGTGTDYRTFSFYITEAEARHAAAAC